MSEHPELTKFISKDIRVILFDIDNTLLSFDACVEASMITGFEKFNLGKYSPEMFPVFERINGKLWHDLELQKLTFDKLIDIRWQMVFDELQIDFHGPTFERFFRDYLYDSCILIPDAVKILEALYPHYLLGVASNGPEAQQKNRLEKAGIEHRFTFFFISEAIGYSKPDSRFFDVCKKEINQHFHEHKLDSIQPAQILIVGDSVTSDMDGGIQSGFSTCLFDPKGRGTQGRNVDIRITRLMDLLPYLNSESASR